MNRDAKVGLLLGLSFIFIIAFVINGLPKLHSRTNNNELTTDMLTSQQGQPGIGLKQRDAVNPYRQVKNENQHIRFESRLPHSNVTVVKKPEEPFRKAPAKSDKLTSMQPGPAAGKKPAHSVKEASASWPKVYVVQAGDNLAVIAQKFYGTEHGNKKANVERIYKANQTSLSSPDNIYAGQKLVVPNLTTDASAQNTGILKSILLEKVDSIGARHLTVNGDERQRFRQYVVREGDNLWKIAAAQLGNAKRYPELVRLNAAILEHEDSISVGMCLKLPVR